jgi:hypothetical protein
VARVRTGWLWAALVVVSCSGKESSSGGGSSLPTVGCLQGVVINGLTAERIALPSDSTKGLQVLVQDDLRAATTLVEDLAAEGANPLLAGEYYICDVPLDEEFPVFVWVDGYEPFESLVRVHSTAASRSPLATADLIKPYPTEIANIRLYPKSTQVKDLDVLVTHAGAPLANAQVILRSQGTNFLDPLHQNFLAPSNTRASTQTLTTDATGFVKFPAAELVLGGYYVWTVLPPDAGANQTVASGTFIVGLRNDANTSSPYLLTVDLDHSVGQLAMLSKSTDANDPEPTGTLTVFFNREFEIIPGTEDEIVATLSGAVTAALAEDNTSNQKPDTVSVKIEANKLTLTPVWKTNPDADTSKEPTLSITYSGLKLRPVATPETLSTVSLAETVRFYR